MHESDLLAMLINCCKRGVATRPCPPATHAKKHEGSAYTLGIVLEKEGEVRCNSSVRRKYLDSGLLWCSSQSVATTNAGKQHKKVKILQN